jgi:secondary thiamine-phosphate synthase enzyme
MKIYQHVETIQTTEGISLVNLNDDINNAIGHSHITEGFVIISSRHTTTAITINEYEERLLEDFKLWLKKLAPENNKYLHNDIEKRDCPPDEPKNAHSHLMAMLLGSSETIPITSRKIAVGQYQAVMLVDLDGPRERTVNIQIIGDERKQWE